MCPVSLFVNHTFKVFQYPTGVSAPRASTEPRTVQRSAAERAPRPNSQSYARLTRRSQVSQAMTVVAMAMMWWTYAGLPLSAIDGI